ncbi:MAG TPA: thioredoxin family protein [Tepidisphaeraceae bacterium]|jgi:thiol-disulfide isomerase/thioredoxin|nr:thioredoxin family protein [Tepidisphaeraceae bacterium]
MTPSYLSEKFSKALPYAPYLATGTPEQQRRWTDVYNAAKLTPAQLQLTSGFARQMKILIVSGIWCGDCVQQCPLLQKIAESRPDLIDLRLVDRDQHRDLIEQLRINAGDRVPLSLFLAEDFELCSIEGDRTLSRYRALARSQLGASCPIGIAPPPPDELAATLQDWLNEFERIQMMLRLSARLRKKHGD